MSAEKVIYSCDECTHTVYFTSEMKKDWHMRTIHGQVNNDLQYHNPAIFHVSPEQFLSDDLTERANGRLLVTCEHCLKKFDSLETRELHQKDCTAAVATANKLAMSGDNEPSNQCMLCLVKFDSYDLLVEHHRKKHIGQKCFKCKSCEASFSWQENLERHAKIHTDSPNVQNKESPLLCRVCSNPFHSIVSLSSHMSLIHPDHPLTQNGTWGLKDNEKSMPQKRIPSCSNFNPSSSIKLVCDDEDLTDFVSGLANTSSNNKRKADFDLEELATSRFKSSDSEGFDLVDLSTDTSVIIEEEADIGVHRLVNAVAAQSDPNSLYCHTCDKTYQQDSSQDLNLACEHCGWMFQKNYQLQAHVEHLHADDILQSICRVCQEQFKTNTAMDRHYSQKHPESRTFHCYQCDNQFNTKACLRGHMQRHQNFGRNTPSSIRSGKHVCPHCNMCYTHAHQLLTHITKSHQAFVAKPGVIGDLNTKFVCGFCGKVFFYEGSLKVHLKQHEDKIKAEVMMSRISEGASN